MQKHYWTGICAAGRTSAISQITAAIDRHGAILHSTLLSDIALNLVVEVEPGKTSALYRELGSLMRVDGVSSPLEEATTDSLLFLSITFTDGTGNLALEVPKVPG
ncbi:MAG: hypothetical protein U0U46_14425 [Saprospiraceae bacterium]